MFHLELAKIAATVANKYTTPYLDGSIFEVEYSADWAEAFRREED
jgi:hypothetical protein